MRIARLQAILAGAGPPVEIDVDVANQKNVAARRDLAVDELITELLEKRLRVLALMEDIQPEHLSAEIERSGPPPYREPLVDFLTNDLSSHDLEHANDLIQSTGVAIEPLELGS